ncbi:MAG: hypothetical protein ACP5EP_09340, partial [Acidobacteriaceae bacterium]
KVRVLSPPYSNYPWGTCLTIVVTEGVFGLTWGAYLGDSILVKGTAWEGQIYEEQTKTDESRALVTVPEVSNRGLVSGEGRASTPLPMA